MEKVIFKNSTGVKYQQLKNAIAKDKLRPQMTGVFLDVSEDRIVVTNGHVLMAYSVEVSEGEVSDAIIDPKIFNVQMWLSVPKEDLSLVEFHVTDAKTEVFLGEELVAVANNIPHEQEFPKNWKRVLTNENPTNEINVDAKLLKAALSAIPEGFQAPKITFGNKILIQAIEHEETDIEVVGVVMPLFYPESKLHHESESIPVDESIIGRTTSQRAFKTWNEDFVDEDTFDIVSIERNEILIDKETEISKDDFETLIDAGIKNVFVLKQ